MVEANQRESILGGDINDSDTAKTTYERPIRLSVDEEGDDIEAEREYTGEQGDDRLGYGNEKGVGVGDDDDFEASDNDEIDLGGEIRIDAFCLIDGNYQYKEEGLQANQRVTFPITTIPAVLGRTHANKDGNFIQMGLCSGLSRKQFIIEYKTQTGKLEQTSSGDFIHAVDEAAVDIINTTDSQLAASGFFTLTCLGKNRMLVNGKRVEQGQTVALQSGFTILVSTYSLYFFLPVSTPKLTMEVALPYAKKKRKPASPTSSATHQPKRAKASSQASGWPNLQAELDSLSNGELRSQLTAAIEDQIWERRHQLIGSTLSYRAVLAASQSPDLQHRAKVAAGLSRGEIMQWIASSEEFGTWVDQMLSKLEEKSYQASITKAMIKANFTRTAGSGRYIKWLLPSGGGRDEDVDGNTSKQLVNEEPQVSDQDEDEESGNEEEQSDDGGPL